MNGNVTTATLFIFAVLLSTSFPQSIPNANYRAPKLITSTPPIYPKEAKAVGLGGRVTVRVMIDETGQVTLVDEPRGPATVCGARDDDPLVTALRNSVIDSVKQSKFEPATQDGKPVKSTVWIDSSFDPKLENPALSSGLKILGKAKKLPEPEYPPAARAVRASGAVKVQAIIDEDGNVFAAEAVSGHPLLRSSAVAAACKAKYSATLIDGKPIKTVGVIVYNFQ